MAATQVEQETLLAEDFTEDLGWRTVSSRKSRATTKPGLGDGGARSEIPQRRGAGEWREGLVIKNRIVKASRMPPMPEEHIKIVIRPRGGLNLEKVSPPTVGRAIVEAAGLSTEQTNEDVICPNFMQNILVASTPERSNAERYVRLRSIRVADKDFEVSAYETAPHTTCKGVIRIVDIMDGPAALERNIVNDRNPLAMAVKRIKSTGSVIIVFDGLRVPNFVRYRPTLVRCYLYRKQVDVCYVCGKLGHRADVCPAPDCLQCRGCGARNPEEDHNCVPCGKLCGGRHLTADKQCRQRYQLPYVVRVRRQERARAELATAAAEASQLASAPQGSPRRRSRSRSRSRSKQRPSSETPATGSRSVSREARVRFPAAGGGGGAAGGKTTWADKAKGGISTGRAREQTQEHVCGNRDKDMIAQLERENRSLKAAVDGLVKEIAERRRGLPSGNSGSLEQASRHDDRVEVPTSVEAAEGKMDDEETPAPKKRALSSMVQPQGKVRSELKEMMATLQESVNQVISRLERIEERENITNQRLCKIEVYLNETVVPVMERESSRTLAQQGKSSSAMKLKLSEPTLHSQDGSVK
ncbi:hypothetical protein HPB49_008338 [Dermacentor silvarum]|uniref:Uncharacterized protein n=1 Tax=Dermacentor silvarum TaxID=543639 RepID=A0ACB8C2R1_DERSI|nr:hypothetical protein HPB49_008338 [Dermacentor silvarum]